MIDAARWDGISDHHTDVLKKGPDGSDVTGGTLKDRENK